MAAMIPKQIWGWAVRIGESWVWQCEPKLDKLRLICDQINEQTNTQSSFKVYAYSWFVPKFFFLKTFLPPHHHSGWLLLPDMQKISTAEADTLALLCWPRPSSCIILCTPPSPNIIPPASGVIRPGCCRQRPQTRQLLINWLCGYLSTSLTFIIANLWEINKWK